MSRPVQDSEQGLHCPHEEPELVIVLKGHWSEPFKSAAATASVISKCGNTSSLPCSSSQCLELLVSGARALESIPSPIKNENTSYLSCESCQESTSNPTWIKTFEVGHPDYNEHTLWLVTGGSLQGWEICQEHIDRRHNPSPSPSLAAVSAKWH